MLAGLEWLPEMRGRRGRGTHQPAIATIASSRNIAGTTALCCLDDEAISEIDDAVAIRGVLI